MKNYQKALIAFLGGLIAAAAAAALVGCGDRSSSKSESGGSGKSSATSDEADVHGDLSELGIDPASIDAFPQVKHDSKNEAGFQLEPPKDGDTIAVIHTSAGDVTLRLFPDQAPKAVTNFINLAESGSYNNTTFHYVVRDTLIQGGHCGSDPASPNGVSSFGGMFEDEFCDSLLNLRGAVSMANSGKDSNGSRFFINLTTADTFRKNGGWKAFDDLWEDTKSKLSDYKGSNLLSAYVDVNGDKFINTGSIPQSVKELYEKYGGNPAFDGAYNAADRGNTVFAQVISGIETADSIASAETDDKNVPKKNIVIKSIEIKTYSAAQPTT